MTAMLRTGQSIDRADGARARRKKVGASALTTLTWLIALIFFAPVLWMVLTAFKQESDAAGH